MSNVNSQMFAIYLCRDGKREFLAIQSAPTAGHARARYCVKARITDVPAVVSHLEITVATPQEMTLACSRCGRNKDLKGGRPCPQCPPQPSRHTKI